MRSDTLGSGSWQLDPAARGAILLQAAREALTRGDYGECVALAEELLDDDADDVDALKLVADAAPRYGHAEVGILAARHARARGADIGALEAAALLAACQVEPALAAADALIADPTRAGAHARAHAVRAQCLELLGDFTGSAAAYERAQSIRPDAYPRPLVVPPSSWDALLQAALSSLSPELRGALRGVQIVYEDLPSLERLRAHHPPPTPTVDALPQDREGGEPPTIVLYRRNLARGAASLDELVARITTALEEEARDQLAEEDVA